MDAMLMFWALLALCFFAAPWVFGLRALARAREAHERLDEMERRSAALERRLDRGAEPVAAAAAEERSEPLPTTVVAPPPAPKPTAPEPAIPSPAARPPPAAAGASIAGDAATLEERIALVWFTRTGALAVLVGSAFFFKYAIDNAWMGPAGRVALGAVAGVGAVAFGEAIRRRARALYVQAVQGAGVAILFIATFASHALYHLVPVTVAFAAVAVIALAAGALAIRGRSEIVLALALLGALLAPVLLSTGEDRPAALFGWLLLTGGAALAISARLGFRVVPWIALAGSAALFAGWYDRFFSVSPPEPAGAGFAGYDGGSYWPLARRAVPLAFGAAFLAGWLAAWERARCDAPRLWADAWLVASIVAGHLLLWSLVIDRPSAAALVLAALGALAAALLRRAERRALLPGSTALGLLLAAISAASATYTLHHAWLAAAAVVCALHLAVAAHAWLVAGDALDVPTTAAAVLSGLAFAGFTVELTATRESLLRAALVGAAGAAELAVGAAVLARARAHATSLLGASLGLLAGAAALLLSGASITVVWAAMACAAVALGARQRDPWWVGGGCALFAAAALRVLAVDLGATEAARWTFLNTLGREGSLGPGLLDGRAVALGGAAAALLVAASRAAAAGAPFQRVAAVLATAAQAFLLTLAVTEVHALLLALPSPPPAGDAGAFEVFRTEVLRARADQATRLDTATTLVMGGFAGLLVGIGFWARQLLWRVLGLALFAATLAKLVFLDAWSLSRLQQVLVFLGVGGLLLAAAFLYARFGRRLVALFREGGGAPPGAGGTAGPGAALLVLLAAAAAAGPDRAAALDVRPFRDERAIAGVTAPGLWAFEVDAALFRESLAAPGTLADVRIAGPRGDEVTWALRDVAAGEPEATFPVVVLDPAVFPDGSVRAVLDLGRAGERHGEIRLMLDGDDFLRIVRIETSDDGRRYGVVAEGARVWAVRGVPEARRTWVRHPQSDARWTRVTLLPGAGQPPRISGATLARPVDLAPVTRSLDVAGPPRRSADGRTSLYDLDLGAAGLPVTALELAIDGAGFERPARTWASADGSHWAPAGGGLLWRALPGAPAPGEREGLRLDAASEGRRFLRVEVHDGDAPPLAIRGARLLWRAREIALSAGEAGPHALYVGAASVAAPAYDLGAVLARSPGTAAGRAELGGAVPNPSHAEISPELPFTERHRVAIGAGIGLLVAALAAWAFRLLRAGPEA